MDITEFELNDVAAYVKLTTQLLAFVCKSIAEGNMLDEDKPEFKLLLEWWEDYKNVTHAHQQ